MTDIGFTCSTTRPFAPEVLARLDGVEATIEEPVVATVVDDDLVFTAEGSLWRLPDVMPPAE